MELAENKNIHPKADHTETGYDPNATETTRRRYHRPPASGNSTPLELLRPEQLGVDGNNDRTE